MAKKRQKPEKRVLGFLGVGLDGDDGHKRITRTEHFFLIGGSKETHGRMQDTAIRFGEALDKSGKTLEETPPEQVLEYFFEAKG